MDIFQIAIVILAGIIVGFINTLAGSGSIISLPLLMFLGLDSLVANGTNRIAILMQSTAGTYNFYKKGKLEIKQGLIMAAVASIGSVLGASIAVSIDEAMMRKAVGYVMVFMLLVIISKPQKWWKTEEIIGLSKIKWYHYLLLFIMGVYGGFIQVGTGIFLLLLLVIGLGWDALKGNALKVFIIGTFNIFSLLIYIYHGQVNWYWGLILSIGNVTGTYIATHLGLKIGNKLIHGIVIIMLIISSLEFIFGIFTRLFSLLPY